MIKYGIVIFFFALINVYSLNVYFKFEFFCVDDYISNIKYSEGLIAPINPRKTFCPKCIYYFPEFKHNSSESVCINLVTYKNIGFFSFKVAMINEFNIALLKNKNLFYCNTCNVNNKNKFTYHTNLCNNHPIIITSYIASINSFCIKPIYNDLSIFNIVGENNINKNFYKGKTNIKYILNEETDYFYINNSFIINGKPDYIFDLKAVSLKIINIKNNYGHIYNGNEELFTNNIFNPIFEYLTNKKSIEEGYKLIIEMETRTRISKNGISYLTSQNNNAILNIYISQNNCTMKEYSNNFCQKCKENYGKYENKCYHKNEKIRNLYYDEFSQTYKKCKNEIKRFTCSICPEGTYIKENNYSFYFICEKCQKGYYTNIENQIKCTKCSIPHCYECSTNNTCLECNNNALNGLDNCFKCENELDWIYDGNLCKPKCKKYFYRDSENKIVCIDNIDECPKEMIYLNLETYECKKNISNTELIRGKYQINVNSSIIENISNDLLKELKEFPELINEVLEKRNIEIIGNDSNMQIGKFNDKDKPISSTFDFGKCPEILRLNLNISKAGTNELLYRVIDFRKKGEADEKSYRFYRNEESDKPLNISDCENQTIKYVTPLNYFEFFENNSQKSLSYLRFLKEGIDIFNVYSPIYHDPCYPLATLDKIDLTLNDRREDMIKVNISLCSKGCEYEGINIESFEVLCYCKINSNRDNESLNYKFKKVFENLKNSSNLKVLKCYYLNFHKNGQKNNYFSEIIIVLFIIIIILILKTEYYIKNYYFINLIEFCNINNNKEIINENNINNNNQNIFELIFLFLKKKFKIFIKYFIENNEIIETFFVINNLEDYDEFKLYSIKVILFINKSILTIIINTIFLNDDAMHKIYEDNGKYDFIYRLPILLFSDIISFIFSFSLSKIILNKNQLKDFKNNINNIRTISNNKTIISISYKKKLESIIINFKRCFLIKRIIFYIICIIISIFGWYYISCFSAVYQNTQKHIFQDFGSGLLMSLLILFLKSFFLILCEIIPFLKSLLFIFYIDWITIFIEILFEILIILFSQKLGLQNLF